MTLISPNRAKEVEAEIRQLLDQGMTLGDALRTLHFEKKIGLKFLWPGISSILGVDRTEAMSILVKEMPKPEGAGR